MKNVNLFLRVLESGVFEAGNGIVTYWSMYEESLACFQERVTRLFLEDYKSNVVFHLEDLLK